MNLDFAGKSVLVTGGTMGIGLATALAYGRFGARSTLTYRFGSADEDAVFKKFADIGAPKPLLVQADVGNDEDTERLLGEIQEKIGRLDILIANASAAVVIKSFDDYTKRGLEQSIGFSAWPLFEYLRRIKARFGRWPRYVVAMSSTGPDEFSVGYDFVAASKSVLETLCQYLSYRLYDEDIRINVLRSRSVWTESVRLVFGKEFEDFAAKLAKPQHFIPPEEVAEAAVALTSGMLDGMKGQIITVDRGTSFFDNFMRLYQERADHGL